MELPHLLSCLRLLSRFPQKGRWKYETLNITPAVAGNDIPVQHSQTMLPSLGKLLLKC